MAKLRTLDQLWNWSVATEAIADVLLLNNNRIIYDARYAANNLIYL